MEPAMAAADVLFKKSLRDNLLMNGDLAMADSTFSRVFRDRTPDNYG
ncbi:hypothetical protein [Desulfoluna spongiiphila]|nr:hypothetical protein [Desulfoluna spongiiphila]